MKRSTGSRRASRRGIGTTTAAAWTSVALLFLGLGSSPSRASDAQSTKPTPAIATRLSGRLLVAHGDNFAGHLMSMSAELRTTGGSVPLDTRSSQHDALMRLAGRDVVVEGLSSGGAVSVQSVVPADAPVAQTSIRRIAVVLLRTKGTSTNEFPVQDAQNTFFGSNDSVTDWFGEASSGAVSVTGQVFGWYTSGISTTDCSNTSDVLHRWLVEAAAKAAAGGYNAADFDNLVVYTPAFAACNFAGVGYVGANGVLLNGYMVVGVAAHELGHNLGLWHAGTLDCFGQTIASSCDRIDYGDPYDVMGDAYGQHTYNASHKFALGWLPLNQVKTPSYGTHAFDLTSSEVPIPGSTELIVVPLAGGRSYQIERRSSHGAFDQGLSGVWVRLVEQSGGVAGTDDTTLLDMAPSTPTVTDGNLAAGMTFTDPATHVSVTTVSDSGATASISVYRPPDLPSSPRGVSVVVGNGRATLGWSPPSSNGGASIDAYRIVPVVKGVPRPATVVGANPLKFTVPGLKNGGTYRFRIAAHTSAGWGDGSPPTGDVVVGAPAAPAGVKAVKVGPGAVKVSFARPAANGAPITRFDARCTSTNGGVARHKSGTAGPLTVTALTKNRRYSCRVKAVNSRGAGTWSAASGSVIG